MRMSRVSLVDWFWMSCEFCLSGWKRRVDVGLEREDFVGTE